MPKLTRDQILSLAVANGKAITDIHVIGPFRSGNKCNWYLVNAFYNGRIITKHEDCEYLVLEQPTGEQWGWDISGNEPEVHYAFADACKIMRSLLESLVDQIGKSDLKDEEGHDFANNQAYIDAKDLLEAGNA